MGRSVTVAREQDAKTLGALYRAERDYQTRPRLHALWAVWQGRSMREAAEIVSAHERAVQQWLTWYRQAGLAGIRVHRRRGPVTAAWLLAEQQAALVAEAVRGVFYTAHDAVTWEAKQFGVPYRLTGTYRLLARRPRHLKVPRAFNPKASPVQQAASKRRPESRTPGSGCRAARGDWLSR